MIKWYLIRDDGAVERPVLAVDIGGTKINLAIISSYGGIVGRRYQLTEASKGPEAVIGNLLSGIDAVLAESGLSPVQLSAISVAAAGVIDMRNGLVATSPNLPGWNNVPLRSLVARRFHLPCYVLNDADAAALGEQRFGAGRGFKNVVLLTSGTGIGGGLIVNGQLYTGSSVSAAEFGHIVVQAGGPPCACGNKGCLEALSSGSAIEREAKQRIRGGEQSAILSLADGAVENITAEMVSRAADAGDALANEIILMAMEYLGVGVASLLNIFNPEVVIIGGGMSKMGDKMFEPVRRVAGELAFPRMAQDARLVPAQLGNDAGVFGASVFAFEH